MERERGGDKRRDRDSKSGKTRHRDRDGVGRERGRGRPADGTLQEGGVVVIVLIVGICRSLSA